MKKNKPVSKTGEGISKRGKKVIGLGLFLLVVGFFVLTKTALTTLLLATCEFGTAFFTVPMTMSPTPPYLRPVPPTT